MLKSIKRYLKVSAISSGLFILTAVPAFYAYSYLNQTFGTNCMTTFIQSGKELGTTYLIVMDEAYDNSPTKEIIDDIPMLLLSDVISGKGTSKGDVFDFHIDSPGRDRSNQRRLVDIGLDCLPKGYEPTIGWKTVLGQSVSSSIQCFVFKGMNELYPFPKLEDCIAISDGKMKKGEYPESYDRFCSTLSPEALKNNR